MFPLLKNWDFDVIINHNRYTLLNREADEMYSYAHSKNISIFNAAPYAGGCLLYTSPSPRDGLLSRMPSSA